ncbi:TIGR03790 family protein [Luteolibacter yonseiensis]|uniref:TIGR03790 family protein n=1 Tax=Luteolibacter yonseiensis TaxID=1144680 RepID=A0A934R0T4_9BACT|nr:TIGR03790 family protein [Luteolibacter yonseiensis]MBK1814063.1 TIGR03790 family protein [Luteolibacter yonseiensis]
MRIFSLMWLVLAGFQAVLRAEISPAHVAVLYNSAVPESRKVAELYRDARGIPAENMIAMDMPATPDISREDYDRTIAKPLRRQFEARGWWKRDFQGDGVTLPVMNKIRVLVTVRGVPLRIRQVPKPKPREGAPPPPAPANPIEGHDEASVDSELAMFGVDGVPTDAVLANKFYQSEKSISEMNLPFLVLTARIDAPTFATCERMIRDAVEVEKTGLWGMAYVDVAQKLPLGDGWFESVAKSNRAAGIPTVVDRFNDTLPKNYPMTDASVYYGWYDWNVSGPFLNPQFRFRKGAVAMHLHSFSAEQLTNPTKNWSGALLEKGAAVTVGNVFEPYLHLTHDFSILQKRLLAGFTWVEACWMAMPATSWQGVVLGDPLYRPFKHLDGTGERANEDIPYRALRAAMIEWGRKPLERARQVEQAADRMQSGVMAEAAALEMVEQKDTAAAVLMFRKAKGFYVNSEDKLRQDFHVISIDRTANRKDMAVRGLREAQTAYGSLPGGDAVKAWLDILDPPPPPPADPTKPPGIPKP